MRAGELHRLAQRERERETMYQSEAEGDDPTLVHACSDDVLQRHVDDGQRDEDLDERWKPESIRGESEHGRHEGDGMRDGK